MKDRLLNVFADTAVHIARRQFMHQIWTTKKGVVCPVCDRSGKVSPLPLNATMCRILIWLYNETRRTTWIYFPEKAPRWILTQNCIGKLRHWGLVAKAENDDPKKKDSGTYTITPLGERFILGQASIPKRVYIYNNERYAAPTTKPEKQVSIGQMAALGGFDLQEIQRPAIPPGTEQQASFQL